jgi:hypothetical protein
VDGQLQQWQSLPPGEECTLTYSFQTHRGLFAWETVQAVACDPLGIVETHLNIPAEAIVQVHPEMPASRRCLYARSARCTYPGRSRRDWAAAAPISGASANTSQAIRCAGWTGITWRATRAAATPVSSSRRKSPKLG